MKSMSWLLLVCLILTCTATLSAQSVKPLERWRFSMGFQACFSRNAGEFMRYMDNQEREVETFSEVEASYNNETGLGWGGLFRAEFKPLPHVAIGIGGGLKRVRLKEEYALIRNPSTANPVLEANRISQSAFYFHPQVLVGGKGDWGSFLVGIEVNSYLNGGVVRRRIYAGQGPSDNVLLDEATSLAVPAEGVPSPNDPNQVIFSRRKNSEGMNPRQFNALAELRIEPSVKDHGVFISLGYAYPLNGFRTSNEAYWSILGNDEVLTLEERDLDSYLHIFSLGVGWTLP